MRSILFVIFAVLVAGGGFFAYWKLQPRLARSTGQDDPMAAQRLNPDAAAVSGVSGGERPWTRVFDKEGRLSSRFRADDYAPRDAGTVHVKNVAADFFQYPKGRVQRVRIEGREGDVEVQSSPQGTKGAMEKGPGGPPKRGRLNDVTIYLFDSDKDKAPKITVRTDNVAFDN